MLTPEMRERAVVLQERCKNMADVHGRYAFGIGTYWNVCGEMVEFLEELLDSRSGGAAHNPMFETEIKI